jgi:RecQ family ATP-dependent DNA helicase
MGTVFTEAALAAALARLGVPGFRPGQREAVEAVLSGRDVFVLLPTGGGKSLVYQLPAVLLPGLTVVVSPLRALMADQLGALTRAGVAARSLTGETTETERAELYKQLRGNAPLTTRVLFLSPEMLELNHSLVDMLAAMAQQQQQRLSLVAIDEAHCIVDYGSTFRGAYSRLGALRERLGPGVPVMALTASATPAMRQQVCTSLQLRSPVLVSGSFDRPNITFEVRYCDLWPTSGEAAKDADILRTVKAAIARGGCAIVYCRAKAECARLAGHLRANGVATDPYHSDLPAKSKQAAAAGLRDGTLSCVCCTVAFGMGLDFPNIRLVVHANPSSSLTAWYQEAGRAGRDGQPALNVVYYSHREEATLLYLARQGVKPGDADSRRKALLQVNAVCALANACRIPSCRRRALLAHFGEKLPRGACAGRCDACRDRQAAERGCYSTLLAAQSNTRELERLRRSDASEVDLSECNFPMLNAEDMDFGDMDDAAPKQEGGSDAEEEDLGEEARRVDEKATAAARRVASKAATKGGGLTDVLSALEEEEEKQKRGGGGKPARTGIAALLLNGRSRSQAPPAAPAPAAGAAGAAGLAIDAALRSESTAKLAAAMSCDVAAAGAAEAGIFAACRGVKSRYKQLVQDAVVGAGRRPGASMAPDGGPGPPSGGPAGVRRPGAFVPPRPAKRVRLVETDITDL